MGNKADFYRRFAGVFFLVIAGLMLVAGETFLGVRLKQTPAFALCYWLLCFLAVFLAIVVALLDLWIVRRRSRAETQNLLDQTLGQIAREKENRRPNTERNDGSP